MVNTTVKYQPRSESSVKVAPQRQYLPVPRDRSLEPHVVLRQSPVWSRGIIWTMLGITVFGVIFSAIATVEQVIPATGQLKPIDGVKEVESPLNGVIKEVLVKNGDRVQQGEVIARFDSKTVLAELVALKNNLQSLENETQFYRKVVTNNTSLNLEQLQLEAQRLKIPVDIILLAKSRITFARNAQFLQAILGGNIGNLTQDELQRVNIIQAEYESRLLMTDLELRQKQKQLEITQVKVADARNNLIKEQLILSDVQENNKLSLGQTQAILVSEKEILDNIQPLAEEGAIPRLQLTRQEQQVNQKQMELITLQKNSSIEYERQQQNIDKSYANLEQLQKEEQALILALQQGSQELKNMRLKFISEIKQQIADNDKKLSEIDSQMTKTIVENEKQISQIKSQIEEKSSLLKYQELTATRTGTISDLKIEADSVVKPDDVLLRIVPNEDLIVEGYIQSKDIGFVKEKMQKSGKLKTSIRFESYSFSEYGEVKGEIIKDKEIGADVLPPDEEHPYYRYPVKIKLDKQNLKGLPFTSGMPVTVNIEIQESRTYLSLFTELFTNQVDSLKEI
jgi:hemolysin D